MSFWGNWYGPYLLEQGVITAGTPKVSTYARTSRSDAALLAEYGLLQAIGVVSQNGGSSGPSQPDTSSVPTWRNRHGRDRAPSSPPHAPSRGRGPFTFVSTNTLGPLIERSTRDS